MGAVHVQRGSNHIWGSGSSAGEGPDSGSRLESASVDEDFSQSSVMVGGGVGGMMVVTVPPLNRGAEMSRRGRLRRRGAARVGLASVEVLGGNTVSQLQAGRLHPQCRAALGGCVATGNRGMWERLGRRHEGFAYLLDILGRYIEGFGPLIFPHLPPVFVGFLDQHVALPLVDGDDTVLGLVLIVVLHLDVDLARGNGQIRHDAARCPPGRSRREEDVNQHGLHSNAGGTQRGVMSVSFTIPLAFFQNIPRSDPAVLCDRAVGTDFHIYTTIQIIIK